MSKGYLGCGFLGREGHRFEGQNRVVLGMFGGVLEGHEGLPQTIVLGRKPSPAVGILLSVVFRVKQFQKEQHRCGGLFPWRRVVFRGLCC